MATLCRAFSSEGDAHDAVDRLLAAGVSGAEVRVLSGESLHDSRDTPVGGFAGTTDRRSEAVGSYAGREISGREAMGSFASDADVRRRGGFRDADRDTVATYGVGVERIRVTSHHDLETMLVEAGLDEATAKADVDALHSGRVLVLVESAMDVHELARAIDR